MESSKWDYELHSFHQCREVEAVGNRSLLMIGGQVLTGVEIDREVVRRCKICLICGSMKSLCSRLR